MLTENSNQAIDVSLANRRLLAVRGNVKAVQKRLTHLGHAAKAAGKIHEWRTNELKELTDKFLMSVDDELAKLN
jgi:hypothetical protein